MSAVYTEYGPTVPFSKELHAKKYRAEGESFEAAMNRIANALQDNRQHFHDLRDALLHMRFMPAGRIQSAVGSPRNVTPYNCFISGPIADSFVDDEGSIMQRATESAKTMRMGGGIGYNFGTLRPRGDLIKKLHSRSSGPISFMEIFNTVGLATSSTDHRRGAQMGVMPVWHPDIEEFIEIKNNHNKLTGFNLSIGVTDAFMESVLSGREFPLAFGGKIYRYVDAAELWDNVMRSTWDWAEPGVLFMDKINRMNNLWYCETISATNPCAEQPMPPFGACLLGSFNLVKYFRPGVLDWDQLRHDIKAVVRAMDKVVDIATYPLDQQMYEARNKRRMGLGVTGLANAAESLGMPYGSGEFLMFEEKVLDFINNKCYQASAEIAGEKGAFPLYDRDRYLAGEFIRTLDDETLWLIRMNGIRNSHLTSIAPTGTISLAADNVSSGIEPVFAYEFDRTVMEFDGPRRETVYDYGYKFFGVEGKRAKDVDIAEHIKVLTTAQQYVDSAVSKTCNVGPNVNFDAFKLIYKTAWELGAKGCTTFRANGKRAGVLEEKEEAKQCRIDLKTGKRECE